MSFIRWQSSYKKKELALTQHTYALLTQLARGTVGMGNKNPHDAVERSSTFLSFPFKGYPKLPLSTPAIFNVTSNFSCLRLLREKAVQRKHVYTRTVPLLKDEKDLKNPTPINLGPVFFKKYMTVLYFLTAGNHLPKTCKFCGHPTLLFIFVFFNLSRGGDLDCHSYFT